MSASKTPITPSPPEGDDALREARNVARGMQKLQTGIVLTGYIRDGKVELDQETLDEIAKKFPNANTAFVAVNAPFDPKSAIE